MSILCHSTLCISQPTASAIAAAFAPPAPPSVAHQPAAAAVATVPAAAAALGCMHSVEAWNPEPKLVRLLRCWCAAATAWELGDREGAGAKAAA